MPSKRKPANKKPKKRESVDRPRNSGQWSESRFFGFIRSSLRRSSGRWGPALVCLKEAEKGRRINPKSGRLAMFYRCAGCGGEFPKKEVQIDHIVEAGSLKCFADLPGFAERLFCEKEGFQVLCISRCHHQKTHTKEIE